MPAKSRVRKTTDPDRALSIARQALVEYAGEKGVTLQSAELDALNALLRNVMTVSRWSSLSTSSKPTALPSDVHYTLTVDPRGAPKATTTKYENIRFNIKDAFLGIAAGAVTLAAPLPPWATLLTVIIVAVSLRAAMTMKLDERQACVIYTMWLRRTSHGAVAAEGLLPLVNEERAHRRYSPIAQGELDAALEGLSTFGCIEWNDDTKEWYLVEDMELRQSGLTGAFRV